MKIDNSRNALLTDFGRAMLRDRYLLPGEDFQDMFARVARAYADNTEHAQRLYDYISNLWFMPATPVLSNGGTNRGLPISCFLNNVEDSLESIIGTWQENAWLAARGGGIGTCWSNVRSIGETVNQCGKTSGIIPFIKVMDSQTLAISQGSLRRGSAACFLHISHPEIEEFIEIRRPTGGDPNRKALNIHHGVVIDDHFMQAVESGDLYDLVSPKDGSVVRRVPARDLWIRLLTARLETGEPYIVFETTVNADRPAYHVEQNLRVQQSNLCCEITLPTGIDHHGKVRTAVCCLSSVNLEKWDEWKDNPIFIEDILRFLDNVLQDFIDRTEGVPGFEAARYSAMRERAVGLGVMGFHSLLQQKKLPFESATALGLNRKIFQTIRERCDRANLNLGEERGSNLDAAEAGFTQRFSKTMAVAPTASISIIAANASPGIDPFMANVYTQKTLSGSFVVRNRYLKELLASKGRDTEEVWTSITVNEGSVQHLDFLNQWEKDVFKTAFEIDQRWIIEHAAMRAPYIDQSQSVNLFLPANVHKRTLHDLHMMAWKKRLKTLYYCRSRSVGRADVVSHLAGEMPQPVPLSETFDENKYDECLACQ